MSGWMELGKLDPGPGGSPPEEIVVQQSSYQLPAWAKTAAMGLVAGAVVGMVVVPVMSSQGILNESKSWHASAVGAAVAVPLVAMYA